MNFNSQPLKFSNSQKSRCNDRIREESPCSACSKTLYSPWGQDNSPNQPNPKRFSVPSKNNKNKFIIPDRFKSENDTQNQCNSCDQKDATRLCLNCNKIYCDGCALDHHEVEEYEDHKMLKLNKVVETLENEKIKLDKNIADIENLVTGKEGVSKALKVKEDEAMEEVDVFFRKCYETLQNQREIVKKELQKKLADIATEDSKKAFRDTYNSNQASEALHWIQSAKNISQDIEKNKITDNNSLLCYLYKQEECYKNLDISMLKNINDNIVDDKSFCQIQVQWNNQLLDALKQENIIDIRINQSVSQNSNRKSQDSSSIKIPLNSNHPVASDWGQKDLPKSAPVQKTDISKDLKKAFENKLEIQVKTKKDSDNILLESISKHNSNNPNVNNGLKNDAHVELFNQILNTKGLKESCQRVSHLILDLFNLTEEGILSLSEAVSQLPSLQTVQLSFYMTLGLFPINLKPLFESLAKLKSLKDFSLKLPTWTHLKGTAFLPLLSNISNISTIQSLTLDFSKCSRLDLQGISEALKYLLRHRNLEKLQISFKGCLSVEDDHEALESLYQNCLNSQLKGIKFDFTECPKLSDESLEVINDINKSKAI